MKTDIITELDQNLIDKGWSVESINQMINDHVNEYNNAHTLVYDKSDLNRLDGILTDLYHDAQAHAIEPSYECYGGLIRRDLEIFHRLVKDAIGEEYDEHDICSDYTYWSDELQEREVN